MATEGWCRRCGKWFEVGSTWRLPTHTKPDPADRTKTVTCRGSGDRPGQTRPK